MQIGLRESLRRITLFLVILMNNVMMIGMEERRTDVLIVGQGLAGSLLAAELLLAGINFLVVDHPYPCSASRIAGGLFTPVVFRTRRKQEGFEQFWSDMQGIYPRLEELLGCKLWYQIPSLRLIPSDEHPLWAEACGNALQGVAEVYSPGVRYGGIPDAYSLVRIVPSGYVDTKALVEGMNGYLREKDLFVSAAIDYKQINPCDGVVIAKGFKANRIVFCEGARGVENPWFGNAGLVPNKGEVLDLQLQGLDEQYVLRGSDVFLLPLGGGRFKAGATYSRDLSVPLETLEGAKQILQKVDRFVDLPYRVIGHYGGLRPAVKDRKPLLGQHPAFSQLFTFNGLGSKGVLYGPYCARLLRECLQGQMGSIPNAFHVQRYLYP